MSRVATFDDAVLTVTRHDLTMDGTLDIVAGTADGHIVALTEQGFAWQANAADDYAANEREGRSQSHVADGRWKCSWDRSLIYPVHDLKWADFDGDGIDELIATTTSASHLFHHDVAAVVEKVEATVSLLEELAALRGKVAQE
eukprot:CAMPEP_0182547580 /NCGR_PEP_ID=MMETSP1323-20130603/37639_1 /TAXON_ID=236787 /ORGANISM="Florenciella parvula, Strain RCC1693" /LENGTH=142 /DNA_ID=CAMNT_0024758895 /DNA_START=45 /DNA_END=470 /DNA_ORIENTATION=-